MNPSGFYVDPIRSKRMNISTFKRNLEECEIGLESKKQDWRSALKK